MLSSPHDSPFILILCVSRSSRNSDGVTPWPLWMCIHSRGLLKTSHSPPIYRYISEMVEDRCCEAFAIIEFSFDPCNIYRDCPRGVPRGGQNVLKWRTCKLTAWITGKWLMIDGYMLPHHPPLGLIWTVMLVWRKGNINRTVSML